MKFKKLALLITLNLSLIATAHADIIINAPYSNGDVCDLIAGSWKGNGKASEWGVINCVYTGSGTIESTPGSGQMTIKDLILKIDASQSSWFCPSTETLQLSGQCHNGKILIQNDSAKLNGELTADAKQANVNGTITFDTAIGKMSPDVVMTLNKI
jgi:hypothetical protein